MQKKYTWLQLKDGPSTTQCFVEEDKSLKVGMKITLKDSDQPDRWWEIISISEPMIKTEAQKQRSEKFYEKDLRRTVPSNFNKSKY